MVILNCSVPLPTEIAQKDFLAVPASDVLSEAPATSYSWSNSGTSSCIEDLVSGVYSVTVTDANNCVATCTTSVNNPCLFMLMKHMLIVSASGGSDGSIDITATGGISPYTYLWNDGSTDEDRSDLSAGDIVLL
jgi:hypothetical protein